MTDSSNFKKLILSAKRAPLVLFLGAGINARERRPGEKKLPNLVPLWDELLAELMNYAVDVHFGNEFDSRSLSNLKQALLQVPSLFSTYERANFIKVILGKQYLHILRDILYRDFAAIREQPNYPEVLRESFPLLQSIIDLCKSDRVAAIVTYNYDDILLNSIERDAYPVCGHRPTLAGASGMPVYYVHGYLPSSRDHIDAGEAQIVLSQDEYFHNMMEPYSWQTTTQLHFLLNYTCLFIGASLKDVNMLRLLHYASEYSDRKPAYAIIPSPDVETTDIEKLLGQTEQDLGPKAAEDVRSLIFRSKSTVLDDSGVNVILAKTYDEVPRMVQELATLCPSSRGAGKET